MSRSNCASPGYSDCGPFEFRHAEGTSFATPMVSAAAALVLGLRPGLTSDQVAAVVERSADDMYAATGCRACPQGHDRLSGSGRVDITEAASTVNAAAFLRPDVREPNDDAGPLSSTLWNGAGGTVSATLDFWEDPVDVYRIRLRKGNRVWITLTGGSGADTRLALWRPGTKTVVDLSPAAQKMRVAESRRPGSTERISGYRARTGGWYFIEVHMSSKSSGAYSLAYRRSG